jgi:hypothetical protein
VSEKPESADDVDLKALAAQVAEMSKQLPDLVQRNQELEMAAAKEAGEARLRFEGRRDHDLFAGIGPQRQCRY